MLIHELGKTDNFTAKIEVPLICHYVTLTKKDHQEMSVLPWFYITLFIASVRVVVCSNICYCKILLFYFLYSPPYTCRHEATTPLLLCFIFYLSLLFFCLLYFICYIWVSDFTSDRLYTSHYNFFLLKTNFLHINEYKSIFDSHIT